MSNKILIVDDDAEIRKVIGIYLENEGYEILKAENRDQALKLIDEIKLIASRNLGQTLEVRGNDELAELCININLMSKELKDKFEYERKLEREKSDLITNVSHDLRTPLTPIIAYLDILQNEKFNTKEQANFI